MFGFKFTQSYFPLFSSLGISTPDSVSGNLDVTLYPKWYDKISMEWSVPTDWGSCSFNVYRSANNSGPYSRVNSTPITGTNVYKDTTSQSYSKFDEDWYIVEAILASGKRVQSLPVTWAKKRGLFVELRAAEIQRREWLLLRKFVGVESFLLRRRTYGTRCKTCWNSQLEKMMMDKCPSCMGTSFEGGYFPAVSTLLQYEPNANNTTMQYFGKFERNEIGAWTISFPEIHPRDLVYRVPDGGLYSVDDILPTELQTVSSRQIMKLIQLSKGSPEYKVVTDNNLIPQALQ